MRKFLAVLISIIMISSLMSGCKDDKNSSSTAGKSTIKQSNATTTKAKTTDKSSQTKTSANGSTVSDNTEQPVQEDDVPDTEPNPEDSNINEEGIDFKGQTIIIAANDATAIPVLGVSEAQDKKYYAYSEALEKYNCKVEWKTSFSDYAGYHNDFMNVTMAGLKFADIATLHGSYVFPNYVKNGLVIPLQDYIDESKKITFAGVTLSQYQGYDWLGQTYLHNTVGKSLTTVVTINQKLLDNEGLEDIWTTVKDKRWNYDVFLDYAKTLTKDLNGDGIIDQWGTGGQLYPHLIYANGVNPVLYQDGSYVSGLHQPAGMHALQYMYEIFSVYKVCAPAGISQSEYYKGTLAMWLCNAGQFIVAARSGLPNMSFVPLPMGPDVTNYQLFDGISAGWAIPSNSGYGGKELIAFISDAMFSTSDPDSKYFINPKDNYISLATAIYNDKALFSDAFDIAWACDTKQYDYTSTIPGLPQLFTQKIQNPVLQGTKSPGVVLAETEPSVIELIESAIK